MLNGNIQYISEHWSPCRIICCNIHAHTQSVHSLPYYLHYSVRINHNGWFSFDFDSSFSSPLIIFIYYLILDIVCCFVGELSSLSLSLLLSHHLETLTTATPLTLGRFGFWLDFIKIFIDTIVSTTIYIIFSAIRFSLLIFAKIGSHEVFVQWFRGNRKEFSKVVVRPCARAYQGCLTKILINNKNHN